MLMLVPGSILYDCWIVFSKVRSVAEPQPVSDNDHAINIRRKVCRLIVADGTNKFYQRMCVAYQGKKRCQDDDRKKRGFAQKIVTRFVFEIVAADVPERQHGDVSTIGIKTFQGSRMIIVIRHR